MGLRFGQLIKSNDILKLAVIATLLFYAYVFFFSELESVRSIRLAVMDSLYEQRFAHLAKEKREYPLVIASIDDESLRRLRERWPWKRSLYADFLDVVSKLEPKVIAFDLSFVVPSRDAREDKRFAEALRESGNVILGSYFVPGNRNLGPIPVLKRAASATGYLNFPRDVDNTSRRHMPLYDEKERAYSFSLRAASLFAALTPEEILNRTYGEAVFSRDSSENSENRTFWSPYDRGMKDIEIIPFWTFMQGLVDEKVVRGKILLIGVTGEIFHDIYNTPLGVLPGVVLQANQTINYMEGNHFIHIRQDIFYTVLLGVFLLMTYIFYRIKTGLGFFVLIALGLASYQVVFFTFLKGVIIDIFPVLIALPAAYLLGSLYRSILLFIENQRLERQSARDGLTNLYTYKYMEFRLKSEFDRAKRERSVLTFVIFDLDRFKGLNDTYGHEKGNEVLLEFSNILRSHSREEDIVARYGGEEFCLLLPGKSEKEAEIIADRIRRSLADKVFFFVPKDLLEPARVGVTVSAGICSSERSEAYNGKELLRLADSALLKAKELGRNQIRIFGERL